MQTYTMPVKNLNQESRSKKPKPATKAFTHLHLQEKGLETIKPIQSDELEVLYIYSNKIRNLENLNGLPNLTSLYLQRNKIEKIENLQFLKNLKRLFLGHNNITVLEGLDEINQLEELHIEKQRLRPGDTFCFDPRTIYYLSESLRILNISGNKITSIKYLTPLTHLIEFDASNNDLSFIEEVCEVIGNWVRLQTAMFLGNPIAKQHRYRDNIIVSCYRLEILDNKQISETNRLFMKRFQEERMIARSRPSVNIQELIPGVPKTYSHSLHKAVSTSLLKKKLQDLSFDDTPTEYIAWNSLPSKSRLKPRIPKITIPSRSAKTMGTINKFP